MTKLKIKGPLTVGTVAQHRASILGASPGPLVLDLKGVDELDTAGLQLLLEAQASSGLRLAAASAAVSEVLSLLRLEGRFPLDGGGKSHDAR